MRSLEEYKERFYEIYHEHIKRDGNEKFLKWIEKTDFFTAPASSKFHCACEGGLLMHSVNVYEVLREKYFEETDNEESFAICALFHDLCKVQFYKTSTRNVKNDDTGKWEKVPFYMVDDMFPYGHGEKSVFLIERFMRLKVDEALAVRWHMGGFDDSAKAGSFSMSVAYEKCSFAVKMHLADMESTYLREKNTSAVRR
ncbi:MAG: hydrolase [Clostridia bacterium]